MGGCDVVVILRMAGMVCLELVLQVRPFLRSADRFQYAAHRGKKFDVWIYNFNACVATLAALAGEMVGICDT